MQTGLFPMWEINYISSRTKLVCIFSVDKNHWKLLSVFYNLQIYKLTQGQCKAQAPKKQIILRGMPSIPLKCHSV